MTAFLPEGVRVVATIRPPREGAGEAAEAEEPLGEAGVAAAAGDEAAVGASEPVRPADEEFERIRLPRDEARQALIADLRASQRSTMAQPGVASPATEVSPDPGPPADVPPEPDLEEPPSELWPDVAARRRRASRRSRRVRLVAAVLLVGLATAAVWYLGFRGRDGAGNAPTLRPALAEPPAPPEPAGTPLGWSVAVEAQEGLPMALRSVDSLGVRDSSITFFVSPAVVGAVLWYRVLAGPLGDSLAAVVAMDRLVQLGLKRPSGVWGVRNTPLTFLLGRFRLRTDAVERMDELNNDGVPTYIVEVPYTRGEPWYHLYAGAYTSALEAEPMRQILQGAGLADSLVVRVGQAAS